MGCTLSKAGRDPEEEDTQEQFEELAAGDSGRLPMPGLLTAKDYKSRLTSSEGTQSLYLPQSGYTIRYAFVTQRGFYPDSPDKANQDSLCIHTHFGGDPEQALFGCFDGHGEYGTQCSQFAKDKVPENLLSNAQFSVSPESGYHRAMVATNSQLHRLPDVDDSMSGTTAITALIRKRMVYVANVGDSRCVLAERDGDRLVAQDLSFDQTPFRSDECERVKRCGARVLTLDQLEGLKDPNVEHWGTEEDNDGDPPRLWAQNATYPGTAFTRSIGDSAAERIGVFAEPEVVSKQLSSTHPFIVIATDGVWEFLPSQSVVDMVSKFEDPQEACLSVVAESYRLWLQHETRTDDITMIVLQFIGMEDEPPPMALPTPIGAMLDYSCRSAAGTALRRMMTPRVAAIEIPSDRASAQRVSELGSMMGTKTQEELASLEEALANNFLFMDMDSLQRREVLEMFQKRFVSAGEMVVRQGEPGEEYFIVEEGHYDVYMVQVPSHQPEHVHSYSSTSSIPKPSFGEIALLYSKPRAATVVSREEGMLWSLNRAAFKGVLQRGANDVDLQVTVQTLRNVEVLQCLSMSSLQKLAALMTEVTFNEGEYIIRQGEEARNFFLIQLGDVVCTICTDPNNLELPDKEVLRLCTGQYFGERALLTSAKRAANVIACGSVQLLSVSRQRFEHAFGVLQDIINAEAAWREQLALQREVLATSMTGSTSTTIIQGNFSVEDLTAKGLLFSTDCSALMLMEHKQSEEVFTVRMTSVADVMALNKQSMVLRARDITQSLEPSFFVPGVIKSFKDSSILAEVLTTVGLCTLDNLLHPGPLDELSTMFIAASVVLGLEHLHWSQLIYRGLSVQSVLITERGLAQLVDFRFACKNDGRTYTLCGNPEYLAPEVLESKGHTETVDLWSLGVFIYTLLAGSTPFVGAGGNELSMYRRICACAYSFPAHFSPLACDLIDKLMHKNPDARLGAGASGLAAIKAHPWFKPIRWGALLEHRHPSPPGIRERIYNFEGLPAAHFAPTPCEHDPGWIHNF